MKKKRKYNETYVISREFYLRLVFYIVASISLTAICINVFDAFYKLENLYGRSYSPEVCDKDDSAYNVFSCFIYSGKDGPLYNFIHFGLILLAIVLILCFIILQVAFIANKFYFKRYVKEYSYGAIVYRIVDGEILYLVLEMNYGHTSFCKGHKEKFESNEETALREIKEETGLDVELDNNFSKTITYHPDLRTSKDVTFFVAENTKINQIPKDEHDKEVINGYFVPYDVALYKITYDLDRSVLKKANKYIVNKLKVEAAENSLE